MSNESSKSEDRRERNGDFEKFFQGKGIDIGCGNDPVRDNCETFDKEHGDATFMNGKAREAYDWVYSSHCLEHIQDHSKALYNWWQLVKPGGYLILVVPHAVLYEKRQPAGQSKFNSDHKQVYTIESLINYVFCVLDNYQVLRVQINDDNFNYGDKTSDQTSKGAQAEIEVIIRKVTDPYWADDYNENI